MNERTELPKRNIPEEKDRWKKKDSPHVVTCHVLGKTDQTGQPVQSAETKERRKAMQKAAQDYRRNDEATPHRRAIFQFESSRALDSRVLHGTYKSECSSAFCEGAGRYEREQEINREKWVEREAEKVWNEK